jgi:hypothetical protein
VVESAPLLREYTLIAYRGFESLSLRQTQKTGPAIAGLFFGSGGERGLKRALRFDKLRSSLDRKMLLDAGSLHFRHSAHPCALPPPGAPAVPAGHKGVKTRDAAGNCSCMTCIRHIHVPYRVLSLSLCRPPRYSLTPCRAFLDWRR